MIRPIILCSLLIGIAGDFIQHYSQAQVIWKRKDSPEEKTSTVIWENSISPVRPKKSELNWDVLPKSQTQSRPPSVVIWEELRAEDELQNPASEKKSDSEISLPSNLEEAEAIFDSIPLQAIDYTPLLDLSHAVPTAFVLSQEDWRLTTSTVSPFKYAKGTGNQNYAIELKYGLSDTFQISGFYSEADDPLNAPIKGLEIRPGNLWEIHGVETRWQFLKNNNWSAAINSSLESWKVGSGGSDSFGKSSENNASPNIFNDSGERVETQNVIGSISLPFSWHAKKKWKLTLAPAVSFLPYKQGKGQGGAGEFYGINPYISGGFLWHPISEIGITASIAQPFGNGTNNFDGNLKYSKTPIFSGGLNLHLNPRIAFQGQLTNGFGLTPATGILTLPSDNRLGYSANFVYTPDAPDTPQPPLSTRQRSLTLGGLTVNTALVPPDKEILTEIGADTEGNLSTKLGFSTSNIFYLDFFRSQSNNIPQTTIQAKTFANSNAESWRGSGKVVLASPLRGAPIWSALRMSFGRDVDSVNNSANGYLFAETPLTLEANSKLAFNINPKVAWSGVGTLWGIGIGTNFKIAPRWELLTETNVLLNSNEMNNYTLGLRWNAFDNFKIEMYGSTASSIIDIGQLLNAEQIRWGSRLIIKL